MDVLLWELKTRPVSLRAAISFTVDTWGTAVKNPIQPKRSMVNIGPQSNIKPCKKADRTTFDLIFLSHRFFKNVSKNDKGQKISVSCVSAHSGGWCVLVHYGSYRGLMGRDTTAPCSMVAPRRRKLKSFSPSALMINWIECVSCYLSCRAVIVRGIRGRAAPVCGDGVDVLQDDVVLLGQRASVQGRVPVGLGGWEVAVAVLWDEKVVRSRVRPSRCLCFLSTAGSRGSVRTLVTHWLSQQHLDRTPLVS